MLAECASLARRSVLELALDLGAPRGKVDDDHPLVGELRFVLVGVLQPDDSLPHETMASRFARCLNAEDSAGDNPLAVQHHQAVHRAHELRVAPTPAHDFRNRQRLEGFLDKRGKHFLQNHAPYLEMRHDDLPLGGGAPLECIHGYAMLPREACDSLGRRLRGRSRYLAFAVLAGRCYIRDGDRQAARCGVDPPFPGVARLELMLYEIVEQPVHESFGQRA